LKKFSTWTFYKSMFVVFLYKNMFVVFLNSACREMPKNYQKRTNASSPLARTCTTWGLGRGGGGGTPGARGVGAKKEEGATAWPRCWPLAAGRWPLAADARGFGLRLEGAAAGRWPLDG
jgi:hypothetical protein